MLKNAISTDPSLTSQYVNLANLKLIQNDGETALQVVKQGLAVNADSALLNILAARIYAGRGDSAMAAASFVRARKASPELAARYPELAGLTGSQTASTTAQGGAQRAGQAGTAPSLPWSVEE